MLYVSFNGPHLVTTSSGEGAGGGRSRRLWILRFNQVRPRVELDRGAGGGGSNPSNSFPRRLRVRANNNEERPWERE